jgi:tRNA dimethylallyltransferase
LRVAYQRQDIFHQDMIRAAGHLGVCEGLLIAGPTASGKTEAAIALAQEFSGEIVNADSMQVYREIPILSAQPTNAQRRLARHHLVGHVSIRQQYSVGRWLNDARDAIDGIKSRGRLPIIIGGTGLYFRALLEGLAVIPPIPEEVRRRVRVLVDEKGAASAHHELQALDPIAALDIAPSDAQRVLRALEVVTATGKSITEWRAQPVGPTIREAATIRIALTPPREVVYAHCERRFDEMLARGALDEVRLIKRMARSGHGTTPKALGVRPLLEHLDGKITLEVAADRTKTLTRRYAKRQLTWIRGQMIAWDKISEQQIERKLTEIFSIIYNSGLTLP